MESSPTAKKNEELVEKRPPIETCFETVFRRLLSGEKLDLYAEGVSRMFEIIAADMLAEVPARQYHWYDGVNDLEATRRKRAQVVFTGEMWVGDDGGKQWKEPFRAIVTDKRITRQGMGIVLQIGSHRAEADLTSTFDANQEKK